MKLLFSLFPGLFLCSVTAWENLPQLPAGRRAEYFLRESDGGYKYGFDTGLGVFAKQSGDAANQVEGHFIYPQGGKLVDVRYTAGTQGYVPIPASGVSPNAAIPYTPSSSDVDDQSGTGDASYSFSYDAGTSARRESSDPAGNVKGEYSYTNDAGQHNLIYEAGAERGFEVKGGSLAAPSSGSQLNGANGNSVLSSRDTTQNSDGSYSFGYSTPDSSRSESADSSGNVQGQYSYTNNAGNHDLSYRAGAETGFVVTGGSLATPNGLVGKQAPLPSSSSAQRTSLGDGGSSSSNINPDGSYSFSYSDGSSSRQESADPAGNVQGRYAYTNNAGHHDLSYEAGAEKGFIVTGGSLAVPNGLTGKQLPLAASSVVPLPLSADASSGDSNINSDGSYSFSYSDGSSSRQESSDAAGNVQGGYAYNNDAGHHDLSYEAGAEKGFVVTGGSLAMPNGLLGKQATGALPSAVMYSSSPSGGSSASNINPDGSYSFAYSADTSSRQESADAAGNVQGRYAYTNDAGQHDLSYEAGAEKGFVVTGGSLATPNGLVGKQLPVAPLPHSTRLSDNGYSAVSINSDNSYSFAYDTGSSSRQESADSAGNVQGRYAYTNDAGHHDLSYEAGAEKGFLVTGGSLAVPNGLTGKQLPVASFVPVARVSNGGSSESNINSDGSYSFSYDAGSSSRQESADAAGNVQGRYAYTNDAGQHDLSYEAGAEKGFIVTGGSLAEPNGLVGKHVPVNSPAVKSAESSGSTDSNINSDGSYSFSYLDGHSTRQESADPSGNVQGRYSYTNAAGHHDLSYEAGAEKGFVVKGGSLAVPNGLDGGAAVNALKLHATAQASHAAPAPASHAVDLSRSYLPPISTPLVNARSIVITQGNLKLTNYLPVEENHKVGYIIDSH